MTKPLFAVYVFVREVDSASKGGMPIDNEDLPVIPVILVRRKKRRHLSVGAGLRRNAFPALCGGTVF